MNFTSVKRLQYPEKKGIWPHFQRNKTINFIPTTYAGAWSIFYSDEFISSLHSNMLWI